MANTYRRFIQTSLPSASLTDIITVTDGTTAIVKSVIVSNDDAAVNKHEREIDKAFADLF